MIFGRKWSVFLLLTFLCVLGTGAGQETFLTADSPLPEFVLQGDVPGSLLRIRPTLTAYQPKPGERYLTSGLWNSERFLSLDRSSGPISFGFAEVRQDFSWYLNTSLFLLTASAPGIFNTTVIPDGSPHDIVIDPGSGSEQHFTWNDTVRTLYYTEQEASHTEMSLSGGWKSEDLGIGLDLEWEQLRGDLEDPEGWLLRNRRIYTEVYSNSAGAGEDPEPQLDHRKLREISAPQTTSHLGVSLPILLKNEGGTRHYCEPAFSWRGRNESYTDSTSYTPIRQAGIFAFTTEADILEDRENAFTGSLTYSLYPPVERGQTLFEFNGTVSWTPERQKIRTRSFQDYTMNDGTVWASFRRETEESETSGGSIASRASIAVETARLVRSGERTLFGAQCRLEFAYEDGSFAVPLPQSSEYIIRSDISGDADFDDADDQIEKRSRTVEVMEHPVQRRILAELDIPLDICLPVDHILPVFLPTSGVDFIASAGIRNVLSWSWEKAAKIRTISQTTVVRGSDGSPIEGDERTNGPDTTESTVGTSGGGPAYELIPRWAAGFRFTFRGGVEIRGTWSWQQTAPSGALVLQGRVPLP